MFLEATAISNFILFAGRSILNHNKMLYPYYKWLFAEIEIAQDKLQNIINDFNNLLLNHSPEFLETITSKVKNMKDWNVDDRDWPKFFYSDIESVWQKHESFITDI